MLLPPPGGIPGQSVLINHACPQLEAFNSAPSPKYLM